MKPLRLDKEVVGKGEVSVGRYNWLLRSRVRWLLCYLCRTDTETDTRHGNFEKRAHGHGGGMAISISIHTHIMYIKYFPYFAL